MISVPKLRGNKDILAFDNTFCDGLSDTLSNFFFVAIVTGTVEAAIPGLESVHDDLRASLVGDLPEAEADGGHPVTTGECERGLIEIDGFEPVGDRRVHHALPSEGLSRVLHHAVVHDHEVPRLPRVNARMRLHKRLQLFDEGCRNL